MKTVKEICKEYGYSQTGLAKRFDIPLRTVQDWCRELRTPPPWLAPMMEEILKAEKRQSAKWVPISADGYFDEAPVYDVWECSNCHEEFSSDGEHPMCNY